METNSAEMGSVTQTLILPDATAEHLNVSGEHSDVVIAYQCNSTAECMPKQQTCQHSVDRRLRKASSGVT